MVEVEKLIEQVVAEINKDRVVYPTNATSGFAPTGERFLNFSSVGQRSEGEIFGAWFTNVPFSLSWLERWVSIYKNRTPGTIYWRQHPYVHCGQFFRIEKRPIIELPNAPVGQLSYVPMYMATCRLIISQQPLLSEEEYNKLIGGSDEKANSKKH